MTTWRISNTTSGHTLGEYEGDTQNDALNAYARDAGYDDYDDLCEVLTDEDDPDGFDGSDLLVERVEPTEPLTNEMIRALRSGAASAGDYEQVRLCDMALPSAFPIANNAERVAARQACADAINEARGMDPETPFVRVVP